MVKVDNGVMDEQTRRARLEEHRARMRALILQADQLKRRAFDAGNAHIRQSEAERAAYSGNARMLRALDTFIDATKTQLEATQRFHLAIVEAAELAPDLTWWQRRRARRRLSRHVALLEDGVVEMEERLAADRLRARSLRLRRPFDL